MRGSMCRRSLSDMRSSPLPSGRHAHPSCWCMHARLKLHGSLQSDTRCHMHVISPRRPPWVRATWSRCPLPLSRPMPTPPPPAPSSLCCHPALTPWQPCSASRRRRCARTCFALHSFHDEIGRLRVAASCSQFLFVPGSRPGGCISSCAGMHQAWHPHMHPCRHASPQGVRVESVSLGQGQGPVAQRWIDEGAAQGGGD